MAERQAAIRQKGVQIMGLGMDRTADDVRRFYQQTGERADFALYLAPWFADREKVEVTPTLFILSPEGKPLFRADGTQGDDLPRLAEAELDRLRASNR